MNSRLQKILEQIDIHRGMADGPEPDYSKLDDVGYGDLVAIEWQGEFEGMVDYGYVMGLPGIEESDANLGGIIHVPSPSNPGGKDTADPEWITLYDIGTNFSIKHMRRIASMGERVGLMMRFLRALTRNAQLKADVNAMAKEVEEKRAMARCLINIDPDKYSRIENGEELAQQVNYDFKDLQWQNAERKKGK